MGREMGCRQGWIQAASGSALLSIIILLSELRGTALGHRAGNPADSPRPARHTLPLRFGLVPAAGAASLMGSSPGKNTGPGVSTRRGSRPGQCVLYQLSPAEETDRTLVHPILTPGDHQGMFCCHDYGGPSGPKFTILPSWVPFPKSLHKDQWSQSLLLSICLYPAHI